MNKVKITIRIKWYGNGLDNYGHSCKTTLLSIIIKMYLDACVFVPRCLCEISRAGLHRNHINVYTWFLINNLRSECMYSSDF